MDLNDVHMLVEKASLCERYEKKNQKVQNLTRFSAKSSLTVKGYLNPKPLSIAGPSSVSKPPMPRPFEPKRDVPKMIEAPKSNVGAKQGSGYIVCYKCFRVGHIVSACPNKRAMTIVEVESVEQEIELEEEEEEVEPVIDN